MGKAAYDKAAFARWGYAFWDHIMPRTTTEGVTTGSYHDIDDGQ